jgi:secondary thiamine-phosphate synthase enzyme
MRTFSVATRRRNELVDVTDAVAAIVTESRVAEGACVVFTPHTTCGVSINENADPDVPADILGHLESIVPRRPDFRHEEGNADAHIKASLVGSSVLVPVTRGALVLGTWQAIFLCEFDGARTRTVHVQVLSQAESPP